MSLQDLLNMMDNENIAEDLDDNELRTIGAAVVEQFQEDEESMEGWAEYVEAGQDLIVQELHAKSTPWEGAANFKSPMLMEACLSFGDRASLELLRQRNLVKADVIGKDDSGEKGKQADRVTEFQNYQLNHEMEEWRDNQRNLYYVLPLDGCMFKRTVYDPLEGRNRSNVIHFPNFAVNQATTDLKRAPFTEIRDFSRNDVFERVESGIWIDEEIYAKPTEGQIGDGDKGSNADEGVENAAENPNRFLEQSCWLDLDKDGYEEPYTVTVHHQSQKVVRIVARFDRKSIIVKGPGGKLIPLDDLMSVQDQIADSKDVAVDYNLSAVKMVRVEPIEEITKYEFMPPPDGTFLGLGYYHLLGSIVSAINTTTNQLTDAGTLSNLQGGFLAKGFRKKMGPVRRNPGTWMSTEVPANQLQSGMLPFPFKEPSAALYSLNDKLTALGQSFTAKLDTAQIQSNTAPTTALAIVQESLVATSAIMMSIISSQTKEFLKLFRLNQRYIDPVMYQTVLDDQEADFETDYNSKTLDIATTADPEQSSRMQRTLLATAEMEQVPLVLQMGGNPIPIVKNYFERIGSTNIDEIFPEEETMPEEEKQQLQALRQAQEQANELQRLQVQILTREQDRLDMDLRRKIEETISSINKDHADIILTLEKAESEDVKNEIGKYTARIAGQVEILNAFVGEDDARRARSRDEIQARIESAQPRAVGAVAQPPRNPQIPGGVGVPGV